VNFQTAIRSGFNNYANFKGRATRAEYWWWALFSLIVQIVTSGQNAIGDLIDLAILLPSVAVAIRRLHDTNRRGWWLTLPIGSLCLAFIAFLTFVVSPQFKLVDLGNWDFSEGMPFIATFEGMPFIATLVIRLALISAVITGVASVVFMLLRGDAGENRFGPPPPPSI
jgi:uncharacterized membrane protein YhaH (DUF805 family)